MRICIYFVYIIVFTCVIDCYSQQNDSTIYSTSIAEIRGFYNQSVADQLPIYNGAIHPGYDQRIKGHAYFAESEWNKGEVIYKGVSYQNIPMRFDEVSQELVIQTSKSVPIILSGSKTSRFVINGHSFVRILPDSINNLPEAGFYEHIYNPVFSVFIKRDRRLKEKVSQEIEREFIKSYKYYISRNGKWYKISNTKSLIRSLGEKGKDAQQYLKKSRIKYKKDPEKALVSISSYYDPK